MQKIYRIEYLNGLWHRFRKRVQSSHFSYRCN